MYGADVHKRKLPLGFRDIKKQIIECIKTGKVQHEIREAEKNLYAHGDLSDEEVINIIKNCRGDNYEKRKHHISSLGDVHILKPKGKYDGYYIKFYFIEPDVWFISVHLDI